ncbi:MAG: NupC/NupG family nucleoside CNT transporter [Phycisphaerales bacterium]|nr:NupC/NupG family nucleoside CNT transporter [Phycisphaerales bacterium]
MHPTGLLGVVVLVAIACAISSDRRRIRPRLVLSALGMQLLLAFLLIKFPPVVSAFDTLAAGMTRIISFADAGTVFIFGEDISNPAGPWGFIFAVKVLPVIIFFASLMSVLYYLGVMQPLVAALAWVLNRTLGVSGTEALSAAANIFLGQTEAPLTVRPYIAGMTRSQIMAIMAPGFASIAGSVLAAYVGILGGDSDEERILFAKHLMTASVMSAPAGLMMAKIIMPETEVPREESLGSLKSVPSTARNVMDAAAEGATDGLKLALNVAAMLVAFVALLAMINYPLAALSEMPGVAAWRTANGIPVLTLQNILGYIVQPLAWCMGVPWSDCNVFGSLMGQGVIATEFVAYLDLGNHIRAGTISPRSAQIATYALCGFANLPSIAIQIGGLSAMAPERRGDFASIAPRAMIAGALACWTTGAIAGVFIA